MVVVENLNTNMEPVDPIRSKGFDSPSQTRRTAEWLIDGGKISSFIRGKDWSTTPLGSIENWPQSLRTTISLCLASSFPINTLWGNEGIQIYNSGYKVLCGAVHQQAIGKSYQSTWQSAWPAIGEPFEKALRGETSFLENQRMFLDRNGFLEETFFTFSLSPIRDEDGVIVGVFHPVTETTTSMLNQRRTRLLRDISFEAANSDNIIAAIDRVIHTLEDYKSDIPGAFMILENDEGQFSIQSSTDNVQEFSDLSKWPIKEALDSSQPYVIGDMQARFGKIPCPEYEEPVQRGLLLPIKIIGQKKPIGFVAAVLSTRLPFDESYMAFFDMFNNSVNLAITNARANEIVAAEHIELKCKNDCLEEDRRFRERKEQELLDSKAAAEAATQSKSAFLANMSHEIRTPLAAILGFTEVLKSPDVKPEDKEKYLNIISRNGNSLVRIIDDILDLSKIEAGKISLVHAPICLTELTFDVISMFSDRATGKGLKIRFDYNDMPKFKIDSDAVRIRQILVNLIGNAIKFTSEGGVTIGGSYSELDNKNIKITITVTDTGIGITEAQASKLFQAFNQADNSTTRNYGGTGLGLALSKKLAKALGGNVSILNKNNSQGTTFAFNIVVKKSIQSDNVKPSSSTTSKMPNERRLQDWKILIVDDAVDNRDLLKILLQREGAAVEEAASGEESLRKVRDFDYDVVLMDIQMPGLDGYQTLAKLRSIDFRKPVFALTAHTMKEERERAIEAGFTGHISKPVNPLVLVETLLVHARILH